jgi:hypothetical protein
MAITLKFPDESVSFLYGSEVPMAIRQEPITNLAHPTLEGQSCSQ